jgi:hypothetical protein
LREISGFPVDKGTRLGEIRAAPVGDFLSPLSFRGPGRQMTRKNDENLFSKTG